MFLLGYHQCWWNYRNEADVYAVHAKFEELDYPYDVLWLDIEPTDGKRSKDQDHMQRHDDFGGRFAIRRNLQTSPEETQSS